MQLLRLEDVGEVLDQIYKSELSIQIASDWDDGYRYQLQSPHVADQETYYPDDGGSIANAVTELAFRIAYNNPQSTFATYWNNKLQGFKEEGINVDVVIKEAENLLIRPSVIKDR